MITREQANLVFIEMQKHARIVNRDIIVNLVDVETIFNKLVHEPSAPPTPRLTTIIRNEFEAIGQVIIKKHEKLDAHDEGEADATLQVIFGDETILIGLYKKELEDIKDNCIIMLEHLNDK